MDQANGSRFSLSPQVFFMNLVMKNRKSSTNGVLSQKMGSYLNFPRPAQKAII